MSKNKINYSQKEIPQERLNIGIDFSKQDVINDPSNPNYFENEEEIKAELVNFTRVDKVIRPYKSKVQTGSYITKQNLQKILGKDQGDKTIYRVMQHVKKSDKSKAELHKDFDLIRDFFPRAMVLEVKDYAERIIHQIEQKVEDETDKRVTPRKRRAFILAIFRSVCRKNGRKLTEELIEEINNRFGYSRKMKLFEVFQAENELIQWKFLAKKSYSTENSLRSFYLNIVNHFKLLKENPILSQTSQTMDVLETTRKYIMGFAKNKKQREALGEMIKHKDNDFAARLLIFVIAKHYSLEKYDVMLRNPEEEPGWKELFLVDPSYCNEAEEIPIRSFKYIFWSSFALKNELVEWGLHPEETKKEQT